MPTGHFLHNEDWTLRPYMTVEQVADALGICRQRVQQVEKSALRKLRKSLMEIYGEDAFEVLNADLR